jgi:hypothetical protein
MHNVLSLISSTKKGSNVNHFLLGPAYMAAVRNGVVPGMLNPKQKAEKTETYNGTES